MSKLGDNPWKKLCLESFFLLNQLFLSVSTSITLFVFC